jgi:superfamily II DNA or RNA helicase
MELRPYQEKAIETVFKKFESTQRVMLQMPTGTGKTEVFANLIKRWLNGAGRNTRVLVIVHRKELVEQILKRLMRYGVFVHAIQSGTQRNLDGQVQVAMVQSLKKPEGRPRNVRLIVVDEAHHVMAKTYSDLITYYSMPELHLLGVTATPIRLSGEGFKPMFTELVQVHSIQKFIDLGYLVEPRYFITDKLDLGGVRILGADYLESDLAQLVMDQKVMANVVKGYLNEGQEKKAILFAVNIEHSNELCARFNAEGIRAETIDATTPSLVRERLVQEFRDGQIRILCNVNIFTEGFDCPDVEVVILARPTKSLSLYLQQVGRAMRPSAEKKFAYILDNANLMEEHGSPIQDFHWTLDATRVKKERKKKEFALVSEPKETDSSRISEDDRLKLIEIELALAREKAEQDKEFNDRETLWIADLEHVKITGKYSVLKRLTPLEDENKNLIRLHDKLLQFPSIARNTPARLLSQLSPDEQKLVYRIDPVFGAHKNSFWVSFQYLLNKIKIRSLILYNIEKKKQPAHITAKIKSMAQKGLASKGNRRE